MNLEDKSITLDSQKIKRLVEIIDQARHIVVTCHVSPDGDAMGSMLSMCQYLWRKGKQATPVVPNIFPDFLKWMPGADKVKVYEKNEEAVAPCLKDADLFVCMDFNTLQRLQMMSTPVMESEALKVMIDHHLSPEHDDFAWVESQPAMSSTCELLYNIFCAMGEQEALTHDEAVCLYTGLMTDTGCFSYNSNRSEIYRIIADLLSKGIDKDKIYRNVFYSYSADRFRLMGYMLYVKLNYFPRYNASLMTLNRFEQRKFSHKKGDTEGFVNIPLQIFGTRLSIFLREDTEKRGSIRVSLRSVDDFPCNLMAQEFFNGGGHLNASGGELHCSMDEAILIVEKALEKFEDRLTK